MKKYKKAYNHFDAPKPQLEPFLPRDTEKEEVFANKLQESVSNLLSNEELHGEINQKGHIDLMLNREQISPEDLPYFEYFSEFTTQRFHNPNILAGDTRLSGNPNFESLRISTNIEAPTLTKITHFHDNQIPAETMTHINDELNGQLAYDDNWLKISAEFENQPEPEISVKRKISNLFKL